MTARINGVMMSPRSCQMIWSRRWWDGHGSIMLTVLAIPPEFLLVEFTNHLQQAKYSQHDAVYAEWLVALRRIACFDAMCGNCGAITSTLIRSLLGEVGLQQCRDTIGVRYGDRHERGMPTATYLPIGKRGGTVGLIPLLIAGFPCTGLIRAPRPTPLTIPRHVKKNFPPYLTFSIAFRVNCIRQPGTDRFSDCGTSKRFVVTARASYCCVGEGVFSKNNRGSSP